MKFGATIDGDLSDRKLPGYVEPLNFFPINI